MNTECLLIGNSSERRRISFDSIVYIKTEDYITTFSLLDLKSFICTKPLKEIKCYLPEYFFQVSRSCIINTEKIYQIKKRTRTVVLLEMIEIEVSYRRYKKLNLLLANRNVTLAR